MTRNSSLSPSAAANQNDPQSRAFSAYRTLQAADALLDQARTAMSAAVAGVSGSAPFSSTGTGSGNGNFAYQAYIEAMGRGIAMEIDRTMPLLGGSGTSSTHGRGLDTYHGLSVKSGVGDSRTSAGSQQGPGQQQRIAGGSVVGAAALLPSIGEVSFVSLMVTLKSDDSESQVDAMMSDTSTHSDGDRETTLHAPPYGDANNATAHEPALALVASTAVDVTDMAQQESVPKAVLSPRLREHAGAELLMQQPALKRARSDTEIQETMATTIVDDAFGSGSSPERNASQASEPVSTGRKYYYTFHCGCLFIIHCAGFGTGNGPTLQRQTSPSGSSVQSTLSPSLRLATRIDSLVLATPTVVGGVSSTQHGNNNGAGTPGGSSVVSSNVILESARVTSIRLQPPSIVSSCICPLLGAYKLLLNCFARDEAARLRTRVRL
jgi:hypothetical protein